MPSITKLRRSAFIEQGGRCIYCEMPMWLLNSQANVQRFIFSKDYAEPFRCTAEHLIAQQDGGRNTRKNVAAACLLCNSMRHQSGAPTDPVEYKYWVLAWVHAGLWHEDVGGAT